MPQAWGRALRDNKSITSLNLESNSIGAIGISAIADSLQSNTTLCELKLANQRVACSQAGSDWFGL